MQTEFPRETHCLSLTKFSSDKNCSRVSFSTCKKDVVTFFFNCVYVCVYLPSLEMLKFTILFNEMP